ncbi:hypothetical protein CU098_004657 [Rhizopus stolonifer]|uniref:Major facilitator superfamily (MFS) profile domain-containing protein n=1 Tax=Rhizopus stolonifer TaxID=4846 RepID=A0A367KR74_RHIST|nr:hypothetical protein CU098_004657 [Rhizopus stolonifer]
MVLKPSKLTLALAFLSALIVANVSGPQYIYPTFGSSLNDRFEWTPVENSIVSTSCFIGVSFSGPLCAWMLESLGITKTLRISAVLVFLGPFLVAQTYAGRLPSHFILCTVYLIFTGLGGAAAFLCTLDSQSHNFKERRGLSMGLTTASVGICGVVFSQINDLLFGPNVFSVNAPYSNDSTYHFLMFLSICMATGILLGSFFLGPIVPAYEPILPDRVDQEDTIKSETTLSGTDLLKHPIGGGIFCALFIVIGIGYVYLANIGQILHAISSESDQHDRNLHITLFSLGNCGSRVIFGALSDLLKNKYGVHRVWAFVYAIVTLLLALMFLVSHETISLEELKPCTVIISMSYGILFGVAPAVTTEFGTKVFARNWGLLLYAPAFGSQLFNVLFGVLYGTEAEKQHDHLSAVT